MPRITKIACAVICTAAIAVVPAVAQARPAKIETTQDLKLNAYAKNISGYAGPKNTQGILPAGKLYVAEVSGTISYYERKQYTHPSGNWNTLCGHTETDPLVRGPVGMDAEFVFGRPWTSPCPLELPVHWTNFEISTNNGSSYSHPGPLGGPFSEPTVGHKYSYPLIGSNRYALFRLKDQPKGVPETADNYGRLYIHVREAVATDCAGGGFAAFGEPDEATCVAATS
jgi:hypothetical protein